MASSIDGVNYTGVFKPHEDTASCACPVCAGLECMERPRYFAGQLLTEKELNSEQAYMLAKNRLHNRYLHGWGVVCGLQVVCHECKGWVTVKQGYAIDPCGSDIIACEDAEFDVIDYIRKCRERDKRKRADCDPLRPPRGEGCEDVEEHWCLTISYEEKEARPTTALRQERKTSCGCSGGTNCGCGTNGGGKKGGCGCSGGSSMTQTASRTSARVQSGVGLSVGVCEPTRIIEGYKLDMVQVPPNHCHNKETAIRDAILKGTLFGKIWECFDYVFKFIARRVPQNELSLLFDAYNGNLTREWRAVDLYNGCCRLRQAITDLYDQNPLNVRCSVYDLLEGLTCPPAPGPDEQREQYQIKIQESAEKLFSLLFQYLLDCVCMALLPSCGPDPTEDRLVLACMTIKQDKIVKICNFSCRKYAGAFPTAYYWSTLVPILPLLSTLIAKLCCAELITGKRGSINPLATFLNALDPSRKARQTISEKRFAIPRIYAARVADTFRKVPQLVIAQLTKPESFNLATILQQPANEADSDLKKAGVITFERNINSIDEVPTLDSILTPPLASRGDKIVLYKLNDKVVGFKRYDEREEFDDKQAEMRAVKDELAALRQEMTLLKSRNQVTDRDNE